jgi:hypothetical protein
MTFNLYFLKNNLNKEVNIIILLIIIYIYIYKIKYL